MPPPTEGQTYTYERAFTPDEVRRFGDLSGDRQPIHTEPDADGRLVAQGLLTATLPTKIGGDLEVLARRMTFEFVAPVYTGDTVTCTVTLTSVRERPDRFDVDATVDCRNQDEAPVLTGTFEGLIWR